MPLSNYGVPLAKVYQDVEAIKSARNANRLDQYKMQDIERANQERASLADLYRENPDDLSKIPGAAARAGLGPQVPAMTSAIGAARQATTEAGTLDMKQLAQASQALDPNDPNTLGNFKQVLARSGVKPEVIASMPDSGTPEQIQKLKQGLEDAGLSALEAKTLDVGRMKAEKPSGSIADQLALIAGGVTPGTKISDVSPQTAKDVLAERKGGMTSVVVTLPDGSQQKMMIPTASIAKTGGAVIDTGKDYSKDVIGYQKFVKDSDLNRVLPALEKMEELLKKYPAGPPGAGGIKNISVAKYLLTPEGREFNRIRQWIFNTDLKVVSGGAVTDTEAERAKIANALGPDASAEDYRRAYNDLIKPLYLRTMEGVMGGYPETVRKQYVKNRGTDLDAIYDKLTPKQSSKPLPGGWSVRMK